MKNKNIEDSVPTGTLSQKSGLRFVLSLINVSLGFLGLAIVSRFLGAEIIGHVGFYFAIVATFGFLTEMGYNTAHLKKSTEGLDTSKCNTTLLLVKTGLILISISLLLFWNYLLPFLGLISNPNLDSKIFIIAVISFALEHYNKAFRSIFSSTLEIAKSSLPKTFGQLLQTLAQVFVSISSFSAVFLASTYLIGSFASFCLFIIFLKGKKFSSSIDFNYIKIYTAFAIPVSIVYVLNGLTVNLVTLGLGYFTSNQDLGFYLVSRKFTVPLVMAIQAYSSLLFVILATSYHEKNSNYIVSLSHKIERYSSLIFLPIAAFIFIFADSLVHLLFGDEFKAAANVTRILIVSVYFRALSYPFATQILASGKLILASKLSVFHFISCLTLMLLLIPKELYGFKCLGLGLEGAGIVILFLNLSRYFTSHYFSKKIVGTKINVRLILHFIAIITSSFIVWKLSHYISILYLNLIIGFLFINLIFYFILYIFSEFTKEDVLLFNKILNPFNIKEYIRKELGNN